MQNIEYRRSSIARSPVDAIIIKDANGMVTGWNPAAEKMFGYTESEILGRPITVLIAKERQGEEYVILARILRGEHILDYETARLRRGGEEFTAVVSISPVRSPDGHVIGAATIIRDMTVSNDDAQANDDRFRVLFETIVDAAVVINSKGIIQAVNPATVTLFGFEVIELIGKNVSVLMPPPYAAEHDQYIGNHLSSGVKKVIGISRETVARRKDGSIFPIELTVSGMDVDGERMFAGIVRDITQRKEIEAANDFEQQLASELLNRLWESENTDRPGFTIWRGEGMPCKRHFSGDLLLHASAHGHIYVLHADSMGHGLVAALPLLPLGDLFYSLARSGHTVEAIATNLNRMLFERMPRGRFVAATILCLKPGHRSVEFWGGAMPPILVTTEGSNRVTQIGGEHPALGVLPPDQFDAKTLHWEWDKQRRQHLCLYSDGITDAQSAVGEFFGPQRTQEWLAAKFDFLSSPAEAYKTFIAFIDPNKPCDDVSLLIVDCHALQV